jgi:hypothetical protein
MFARMSRYGPAAAGTTRHPLSRPAVRSGRSRHASAQNDTRKRSKIEQSSGLLIRGFGVRVPGGAPVLTWHYAESELPRDGRFGAVLAPCSLVSLDRAVRGLSKMAARGANRGAVLADWPPAFTRPLVYTFGIVVGTRSRAPFPMLSRSVKPAGDAHSRGPAPRGPVTAGRGARALAHDGGGVFSGSGAGGQLRSNRRVRWVPRRPQGESGGAGPAAIAIRDVRQVYDRYMEGRPEVHERRPHTGRLPEMARLSGPCRIARDAPPWRDARPPWRLRSTRRGWREPVTNVTYGSCPSPIPNRAESRTDAVPLPFRRSSGKREGTAWSMRRS